MKKALSSGLIMGIMVVFVSLAMAGSSPQLLAPQNFSCTKDADSVLFQWDMLENAQKYSVDVEVLLAEGPEGGWEDATIITLSFGTSDRTDGAPISQPDLDVPADSFGYYLPDGITWVDLSGYTARASVKGIGKIGKTGRSQNNPFSNYCGEFTLP
jgi:hypothetical protein